MANNDSQDSPNFNLPILLVGIGGAGSKLAINSSKLLESKLLLISNDKKDLDHNYNSIFVNCNSFINPSTYRLRSVAGSLSKVIRKALEGFRTIIVFANLAGRAGTGIAPVVCREAKLSCRSRIVSIAIMPFKYEKDRIFQAGVSLSRLQDYSDSTIIVDNDSLLDSNPDLSAEQCYQIANDSLYDMVSATMIRYLEPDLSILCTGKRTKMDAESSIKSSLAMLCEDADLMSVKKAALHISGGQNVQVGILDSIVNSLYTVFNNDKFDGISTCISNSDEVRSHLLVSIRGKTKFDMYDPLAKIIPRENVLDWEDMDSSPDIEVAIPNLE